MFGDDVTLELGNGLRFEIAEITFQLLARVDFQDGRAQIALGRERGSHFATGKAVVLGLVAETLTFHSILVVFDVLVSAAIRMTLDDVLPQDGFAISGESAILTVESTFGRRLVLFAMRQQLLRLFRGIIARGAEEIVIGMRFYFIKTLESGSGGKERAVARLRRVLRENVANDGAFHGPSIEAMTAFVEKSAV